MGPPGSPLLALMGVALRSLGRRLELLGRAPSFRRLFLATLGSGLGTWLAYVALTVDVFERTDSGSWVAALLIADFLPIVVVGFFLGPLVDRLSRRRLMIASDLVRFGVFCALPFAGSAATIVALAAVAGMATGLFRPALYAGVPNLVEEQDLPSANSLLQSVENLTWALTPLLGGVLVAVSSPDVAYWINAVTFLVSAALLARIPHRLLQAARAESRGHFRDLIEGTSLVVRSAALLAVLVTWNLFMFASAGVNVAEVVLADVSFDSGAFGFGLLVGATGAGLVLGSFVAAAWLERWALPNVYGASIALTAVGIGCAAIAPSVWVAAAFVVVLGFGNGAAVVCNALLVQRGAPDHLRGRAFTVIMSSNYALLGLGMAIAGPLTDLVGPRWLWGGAAVVAAVAAVLGFTLTRRAGMRAEPPLPPLLGPPERPPAPAPTEQVL
jgi:MFS family permease